MTSAPVIMMANPPDPDLMVKRLFTVAEILSCVCDIADTSEFLTENRAEKHDAEEIGYRESKDRLHSA